MTYRGQMAPISRQFGPNRATICLRLLSMDRLIADQNQEKSDSSAMTRRGRARGGAGTFVLGSLFGDGTRYD